jgi:uncharacterized integral membrane protein
MMLKLLRTLLAIVGLLVVVVFAVANRHMVDVSFWPMPYSHTAPLYAVLLAGIVIGVVLGGLAMWLSGRRRRVTLRHLRSRVSEYEYQEQQRRRAEDEAAAARVRGRALAAPAAAG